MPVAARLAAFYAAAFLLVGIQLPFWPAWLAGHMEPRKGSPG